MTGLMMRVAALLIATVVANTAVAQEPEIFIGPSTDATPTATAQVNYLAKCLADPGDAISCYIARTAKTDGGLESAIQDQIDAASYIACEKRGGVCLELATLDLSDDTQAPPAETLPSVDVTILFDYDSSVILAGESAKLVQLAAAMKDPLNTNASFAVIGHTDSKGSDAYNCRLSLARSEAVAGRFAGLGIAPERLITIGAGEHILRKAEDGEAAENRRVGFARLKAESSIVMERLSKLCKN